MRGYEWKSSLILLLLCHSIIPTQSFFFRPFFRRQSPPLASSNRDHVVSGAEASEQQPTSLAISTRPSQNPQLLYATVSNQDFHVPKSLCIACEKFPWTPVAGADTPTLGLQSQQIQSTIPEQPSVTLVVNKLGGGNRRPFAIQFDSSQTQNNVGSAPAPIVNSVNQEPPPPEPSAPPAPEYGTPDTRQPTVLQPVRSGPVWHPTSRPAQFYQTPALSSQLTSQTAQNTLQPAQVQTVSLSFNNEAPPPFPPQRPSQQRPSLLQPVRTIGPYRESFQPPSSPLFFTTPKPVDQSPPQPPVAPPSKFNFRVVRPGGWGDSLGFSKNRPPIPPITVGTFLAASQQDKQKQNQGFQIQGVQPAQLIYHEHIKVNENLSVPGPIGNQYGVPNAPAPTGSSQQQSQPESPPPTPPQPQQAPQNIKVPILPGPIGSLIINQLPFNNFPSRFTFPKLGPGRQQYGPPRPPNQQYGFPLQNRPISSGQYGPPINFGPLPQNRPPPLPSNYGPPPSPPANYGPPPQNQAPPPSGSYGPPAPPNQPPPQNQPPSGNYGPPPQNQPPSGNYGPPPQSQPPSNNFGPPAQSQPPSNNFGPPPQNQPPSNNFGPPPQNQPPSNNFGPPPQSQPPSGNYGPPPQNQPPSGNYGPPPQSQPPSNNFGPPPQNQPPSNNFGPPPQNQPPSNNFGPPPQSQPPSNNFGPPPQSQPPSGSYGPPPQSQPPPNNFGPPPQNQAPSNDFVPPPQSPPSGPSGNYGPPPQSPPSAPAGNYGPPPQSPPSGPPSNYGSPPQSPPSAPSGNFGTPSATPPLLSIQMRPPKHFGPPLFGISRPQPPSQYGFPPQQGLPLHFRPPAARDHYEPPALPAPTQPFIGPQPAPTQPAPDSVTPAPEEQPRNPISDQPAPTPPPNYGPPPGFISQLHSNFPQNLPSPSLPERPFPPVISYGPPKNGNHQGPTFFIIPQNSNFMPNPPQSLSLDMQPPLQQVYAPNYGLPMNFAPNFQLQPPAPSFNQQPLFGLQSSSNFVQQSSSNFVQQQSSNFVQQPTAPSGGSQQLPTEYGQAPPSFSSPQQTGPSSDEGTDSQPPSPSGPSEQAYYPSPSAPSESEIPADKLLPDQVPATNVQVEPVEEPRDTTPVSIPYILQLHQENRGSQGNAGLVSSFQLRGNGNPNIVPIPVPKFVGSESQREIIHANLDFVPSPQKTTFSSPIPSRDGELVRNPHLQSAGESDNGSDGDRNFPHSEAGKAVGIQGGWEIIPATQYDITHLFKNGPEPNTQTRPDPLPVPVPIPVPASPPPTSPLFIVSSQTRTPEPSLVPDTSNQVDQVSPELSQDVRENGLSQQSVISGSMIQNFPSRPFSVGIPIVQATQVQQPNTQFDPLPPSIVSALHHAQRTSFLTHSHLVPSPEGSKETVYINSVAVQDQNGTEVENYSQTVATDTANVDEGKDSNRIENIRAIEHSPGAVPVGCNNDHWMVPADGQKNQVLVPSGKAPYFLYYPTPVQQSSVYWVEQPTPQFSPSITQPISTLAPANQLYDPKATAGSQTVFSPPVFGWSPKVVPTSNALVTDEKEEKVRKQYEQELSPRPTTRTPFDIISVGKESLEEENVQSIENVELSRTTTQSPVTTTQPLFKRPTQFRPSLPVIAPAPSESFRPTDYETSTPKFFDSTEFVKIKSFGRLKSPKLVDEALSSEKTYTEIIGPTTTADCITDATTETPLVVTSANAIDASTTTQQTTFSTFGTTRTKNGGPERIRLRVGARFPAGRPSISSTLYPTTTTPEPELITGTPSSATVVPVYRPSTIEPFTGSSLRTTAGIIPTPTNSHVPFNHLLTLEDIYKNSETKQVEENRETIGTSTEQSTSFSVSVDTHLSSSSVSSPAFGEKERTSPRKLYSPDEVAALGSDLQAQSILVSSTPRSSPDTFGSKTTRFSTTSEPDLVKLNTTTSTSSPTMVTSTKVVKTVRVRQRMRPGGSGFTGPIRSRFTHGGRVRIVQRPVTQEYIKNFPEFAAPEGESLGKEEEEEVKNALIDLKKIR
ncbi:unnamed protein product [Allacma fusca]|uniref:Uncharacterized protein n=1 Tax=Allacma fusca TaxID=39272 RepID=A0A8J2KPZ6_9HEXA|nr:unnamed protein product [Allacma fusca]